MAVYVGDERLNCCGVTVIMGLISLEDRIWKGILEFLASKEAPIPSPSPGGGSYEPLGRLRSQDKAQRGALYLKITISYWGRV